MSGCLRGGDREQNLAVGWSHVGSTQSYASSSVWRSGGLIPMIQRAQVQVLAVCEYRAPSFLKGLAEGAGAGCLAADSMGQAGYIVAAAH